MAEKTTNLNRGLPGETPLDDISGLKLPWVQTCAALSKVEFTNVGKAIYKYTAKKPSHRRAPFTSSWMCKVHREMYGDVWVWAGVHRTSGKNIGVHPSQIEVELEKLARDISEWRLSDTFDLIAQAATIHHRAVWIHPFENGNGRWSRLLANIWLRKNSVGVIKWPEDGLVKHESSIRSQYIAALKKADGGEPDDLIDLHRKYCLA